MPDGDMWQRFTNPATRVIHFAQEEAKRLGMNVVGTEHILLGLVREGEGVAARVLERLGVSLGRVRSELNRQVGASEGHAVGSTRLTLSPKAKKALEYALQEARELNPKLGLLDFVDTEHLLLGLIREGSSSGSKAVRLLEGLGVDLERVRKEVMNYLGGSPTIAPTTRQRSSTPVLDAFGRDLTKSATEGALDRSPGTHPIPYFGLAAQRHLFPGITRGVYIGDIIRERLLPLSGAIQHFREDGICPIYKEIQIGNRFR